MRSMIALGLLIILPLAAVAQDAKPKSPEDQAKPVVARPNPDASGIYHAGDGVTAPKLLFAADPEFSDKARRKKVTGSCVISIVVDAAGNPQNLKVVRSVADGLTARLQSVGAGLDANAIKAAKQYRFEPATFKGMAVPFETTIEISYRIY